jgi:uncharacterized protein
MTVSTTPPTVPQQLGAIHELDRAECLRFLAANRFGRIVVAMPDGTPVIRPVNYLFDEPSQSIVFRTQAGSKLHALLDSRSAAFEIDSIDPSSETGWSVIISGLAEEVTAPGDLNRLIGAGVESWGPATHGHLMRVRAFTVTGRVVSGSSH